MLAVFLAIGIGTLITAGVSLISVIGGGVLFYQKRKNAPDMVENKKAGEDRKVTDKTTKDLASGNIDEVEKDLS